MKRAYDFTKMKSRRNPYASKLKRQVTIRMGEDVIEYFKAMAEETGVPCHTLINLYLRDCMVRQRKPDLEPDRKPLRAALGRAGPRASRRSAVAGRTDEAITIVEEV